MDLNKLNTKEVRAMDAKKVADTVKNLRKELVGLSMDVYNAGQQAKSKARNMRKTLARLLTVGAEKSGVNTKKKK
jgi:ribosomal protein L29